MIAHIKKNSVTQDNEVQTVCEHLENVAHLGDRLGKTLGLKHTLFLTGLLHDIGKETKGFNTYILKAFDDPKSVRRGEINHSSAGGKYIFDRYYKGTNYEKITAQIISEAIVSHHGLTDTIDAEGNLKLMKRVRPSTEKIDYDRAIENNRLLFQKYDIQMLFMKSVKEITLIVEEIIDVAELMKSEQAGSFMLGALERLVLSFLVQADRTDTAAFMNGEIEIQTPKDLWKIFKNRVEETLDHFKTEDPISVLRQQLSDECLNFAKNPSGVYRLSIPTGGGKTLSSLRYALEHADYYGKDRIFYIAPFLSILEQNAGVIRETLQDDTYILEHHSNIIIEDDGGMNSRYQTLTDTWDSPMILTTMVQFLNTLFNASMQSIRRMHRLSNSIIIFDEIQSLPIKCIYLFNTIINFLSKICGATVILCSATQPLLDEVDKNILYGLPKDIISDVQTYAEKFKRVEIKDTLESGKGYTTQALVDFVFDKFEDNLLIILNTKSAVKKLYQALKESSKLDDIELIQLTTYMCAQHRSDCVDALKKKMKTGKVICISTQLIEAGVDISFKCVIRSRAGLDSIIQAAGRCNRTGESDLRSVYIINYKEENLEHLKEIDVAGKILEKLLYEYRQKPEFFDYDLLSQKSMDRYYKLYFFERQNEMGYRIGKNNVELYDLLSANKVGCRAYQERTGRASDFLMNQAFKQAGTAFEVIGNNTVGLIVPYGNGKTSVEKIKKTDNLKIIKQELRFLQRYTVNVFATDKIINQLDERGAINKALFDGKIYVLEEGFYRDDVGVSDYLEDKIF
ncbi:MAG: CRISPR-associated helicase Cas3' [Odoribacter sp.]